VEFTLENVIKTNVNSGILNGPKKPLKIYYNHFVR
jgi:hypothetical protein